MKHWKKWVAILLTLILTAEALPLSALADAGTVITEGEIRQAMLKAGLREASWQSGEGITLEAEASGYHDGMTPEDTWSAQMLMDWLDDMLMKEIYNVTNTYARAEAILESMEAEDPAEYARFAAIGRYDLSFYELCHQFAVEAEDAEEQGRYYHTQINSNITLIQQNIEILMNEADALFDSEKIRYSEQIREASKALDDLKEDVLAFAIAQMLVITMEQEMLDGKTDPAFSKWIKEVLDTEEDPIERTVSASAVTPSGGGTTLADRLLGSAHASALADKNSKDVRVKVISENDFSIMIRGKDNQPVSGAQVRVKDQNGTADKTLVTDEFGSVVFNANDFICDYDKEMELSLWVDAEAQGYRSFYIPWLTLKRGGVRTEHLTLLSGPENGNSPATVAEIGAALLDTSDLIASAKAEDFKPYVYSATFNGYDILRSDKTTIISHVNDAQVNFEIILEHPAGKSVQAPVLHYWSNEEQVKSPWEHTANPTSSQKVSDTQTKFIYRKTWKRDLSPDITKDQKPYFILPDTGEKVKTTLMPLRSAVDTPTIAGTDANSPLSKVVEDGFGLNFEIPGIGGKLSLSLPFQNYLPKVSIDPFGYVTITFGSSLVDPTPTTNWKNEENEKYDKAMKNFQHSTSIASKKQQLGTARDYYKKMGKAGEGMASGKFDFGWFLMLSGRKEKDKEDNTALWSASGMAGFSVTFSADYTQPYTLGPIPFYVNFNFSLSAGFGIDGLAMTFYTQGNFGFKNFDLQVVRGFTVQLRLALSATLGIGIKGLFSAWISATGALNVVLQFMTREPVHVAVYAQLFVSVGFEIFWIKYSKVILKSPRWMIYSNFKAEEPEPFRLFTAYAEDATEEITPVQLEPERYSSLAPKATKIMDNAANTGASIKVAEAAGDTYLFYIARTTDAHGNTSRNVMWKNMRSGKVGNVADDMNVTLAAKDDYDFDVMSDGNMIVIAGCAATDFDENGYPKGNKMPVYFNSDVYTAIYVAEAGVGLNPLDYEGNSVVARRTPDRYFTGYNIALNPHIEAIHSASDNIEKTTVFGTFDAICDATGEKGFLSFNMIDYRTLVLYSDQAVQKAGGEQYERVQMRSDKRDSGVFDSQNDAENRSKAASAGFVALTKPKEGKTGDSVIELYDYDMNLAPVTVATNNTDKSNEYRTITSTSRKAIPLTSGKIDHIEVLHAISSDGEKVARTIFYLQEEKAGERTESRLKSIYIAPKQGANTADISFEISYKDYDLSLPFTDFRTVTIGASQYLYWLSTVAKEKENDPDVWRISGVYYDSMTGTVSDEIVIAEFTLPKSEWNGKSYTSVPYEITLTESGIGYITTKPNTENEADRAIAPMTLYSFPLQLKPVLTLQSAALMETTVCQGDIIATDLAMMNEGNMGIGSFEIDLILMKNGVESGVVETLYADCLTPANSSLVMKNSKWADTVLRGEKAFYRLKDFAYSPKQHEWLVQEKKRTLRVQNGTQATWTEGNSTAKRISSNVLVPGALGGYTGFIKIPADWNGIYDLRLKVTKYSTYSNWLAAESIANSRQELFATDSRTLSAFAALASPGKKVSFPLIGSAIAEESGESSAAALQAAARKRALGEAGVEELVYELNEDTGMMELQGKTAAENPGNVLLLTSEGTASGAENFYAAEIAAPEPITINCDVHDIDISHRLYEDYYGDEMLDIIINNYATNEKTVRLSCAVYLDDSDTPFYVALPYDPEVVSTGITQTISLPLDTILDSYAHEKARFVIKGIGIEETALVNNEFTLYFSHEETWPEEEESETPPTGDEAAPTVWIWMVAVGILGLLGVLIWMRRRKK